MRMTWRGSLNQKFLRISIITPNPRIQNYGDTMIQQKKVIITTLVVVVCIISAISAGCTTNATEGVSDETTQPTTTESEMATPTPAETETLPQYATPTYDEETQLRLIDEAKDEIIRLFPDIERASLDGYWADVKNERYGTPYIEFQNVDDTSERYMEAQNVRSRGIAANIHRNLVTIRVNPESGDVIFYGSQSRDRVSEDETRVVSVEEAENRVLEFIKTVKGEEFIEDNYDDFYIYRLNSDKNQKNGLVYVTLFKKYKGVQYQNNYIYTQYDIILDRVARYMDLSRDPELMASLTTLSPVPDISEQKAKAILEAKLEETYPDEDLKIRYSTLNGHENSLNWYDPNSLVYAENPRPIRLIWVLDFNDVEIRNRSSFVTKEAIIDAHTKEIISLNFRDIKISPEQVKR